MAIDPKTIGGQIECLARLTDAPDNFVRQVRALFLDKGIALEDEATLYRNALEEAFRREHKIRESTGRARKSIAQLQEQFTRLSQVYRSHLQHLKEIRGSLESYSKAGRQGRKKKPAPRGPRVSRLKRTVVTRPQRDGRAMVPGPKDVQ